MRAPWPSGEGPSIFLRDRAFQTDEYALFCRARRVTGEALDWDEFRDTYRAIGHKDINVALGGREDD